VIYEQAYDRQWLQLELVLDVYDDIVLETRANACLCISLEPLNAMMASFLDVPEQPTLSFAWELWARHTCWICAGSLVGPNSASGWGSKLASLVLDEALHTSVLTIYDLNAPRLATTSGIGQIQPQSAADEYFQEILTGSRQLVPMSSFSVGDDLKSWGNETEDEHGHPEVIVDGDYGAL
jgi:hypothetical protein